MEYIKESGAFTGKIVRAEHKTFHDNVQAMEIIMNVDGKGLKFILIMSTRGGSNYYKHKDQTFILPQLLLVMDIEKSLGVEAINENGFYNSLEGKELSVIVKTQKHMIKRHELIINNLVRVK